jgi:hypothetical protein
METIPMVTSRLQTIAKKIVNSHLGLVRKLQKLQLQTPTLPDILERLPSLLLASAVKIHFCDAAL